MLSFKNLELRSPHFCEKIGDNFGESVIKNRWVTHIDQSQDYVFSTISSQDLISPIYFLRAQSLSCCYCLNSIVIIFKKVFLVCLTDWMQLFFFLTDTSGKSWMISFSGSSEIEQGWGRMAINLQATLIWNRSLGTFTNIIKIMWKSLRISSFLFSNISAPSS